MLVVTRIPGEELIIYTDEGLEVVIVLHGIKGQQARIGIKAAKEVHIDRREVFERKQLEKAKKAEAP